MGNTAETFTRLQEAWVSIDTPKRTLASYGAGEFPTGAMELETHAGVPLQARDVLEVLSGPEAGTKWRAETVHHPGGRSTIAALTVYNGEIPQ